MKLQFPDRVFSTVYILILEQLLMQKIVYFLCFYGLWHPLSKSFTSIQFPDHFFIAAWYYEIGHPISKNICECHTKSYLRKSYKSYKRHCILDNKIMFFFCGFLSCVYFLFVSSQMFWCKLVFTVWIIMFWNIKMMYWKRLPKLYIC